MHGGPRRLSIHLINLFSYFFHHELHADGGGDLINDMSTECCSRDKTVRTPNSSTARSRFVSSRLISAWSAETRSTFLPLVRMSLLTESSFPVGLESRRRVLVVDSISWSVLLGHVRRRKGYDDVENAPEQPLYVALHSHQLLRAGL
jgi:hypothetical protein